MTGVIWCVRTDPDGRFKYAKPRRLDDLDFAAPHLIVWTVQQWFQTDRAACEQYLEPNDAHRAIQRRFCDATGLRDADGLRTAMTESLARYRPA